MKTSIHQKGVCLVGKSWEIRSRLRDWSQSSLTVQAFIQRQLPSLKPKSTRKKDHIIGLKKEGYYSRM